MLINLSDTASFSTANGPGPRAVLWVQGCSIHCRGCHNPNTWAFVPKQVATVESIFDWFKSKPGLRGITLSGGEPFEQALALAELCRAVRAAGADVIAFSGFTRAQIESGIRPHAADLLEQTDLLVDGQFLADAPTAMPLRGSANQQLHFLTDRIRPEEVADLPRGEWVGGGFDGHVSGFAVADLMGALRVVQVKARRQVPECPST
jgi:anaerobic ribonucleoside-triphosphate reductase activating protein